MKTIPLVAAVIVTAAAQGCHSNRQSVSPEGRSVDVTPSELVTARPMDMVPRAVIYQTSAPSDSLVPVDIAGGAVVSFPAPSDLGDLPPRLVDGWYLDTRGVSTNTVFTGYTYDSYKALPAPPAPSELIRSAHDGPRVTRVVRLPYPVSKVTVEMANEYILNNLR